MATTKKYQPWVSDFEALQSEREEATNPLDPDSGSFGGNGDPSSYQDKQWLKKVANDPEFQRLYIAYKQNGPGPNPNGGVAPSYAFNEYLRKIGLPKGRAFTIDANGEPALKDMVSGWTIPLMAAAAAGTLGFAAFALPAMAPTLATTAGVSAGSIPTASAGSILAGSGAAGLTGAQIAGFSAPAVAGAAGGGAGAAGTLGTLGAGATGGGAAAGGGSTAAGAAAGGASKAAGAMGGWKGMAASAALDAASAYLNSKAGGGSSFEVKDFRQDPRGFLTDPRQAAYNTARSGNLFTTALAKRNQQRKPIEFQNMEMPGMPAPMKTTGGFAPLDLSKFIAELEGQLPENQPGASSLGFNKRQEGIYNKLSPAQQQQMQQQRQRKYGRF